MESEASSMLEFALSAVERAVKLNGKGDDGKTSMHCVEVPQISLSDYYDRISKYCKVSEPCYVISLIYMDRLHSTNDEMRVTEHSVHRLLITSILLAAKFRDETYLTTEFYSQVAGVAETTLERLEKLFLTSLDYSLYVSRSEYEHYAETIMRRESPEGNFIVSPRSLNCSSDINRRL
eukprot:TRINITY_DN1639_c3_g2_i1.p1 TRINITY_DN1639_c3_g2~~TRINITY_DN1639_c3_g2_i1.p1  ORF type:complete len:178 (+),score=20.73 TRINITY_DN1639_c3_g2_i1:59-592(+)